MGKKLSDNQVKRLVEKGSTVKLKGFKTNQGKVDGKIVIDNYKRPSFQQLDGGIGKAPKLISQTKEMPTCPKCNKGPLIEGKPAFGCSLWKTGCDFKYPFADIKVKAASQKLTKDLVIKIISN